MRIQAYLLALAAIACGGNLKEVEHAKRARYDAELPVLLAETADVVRQWYVAVEVDPRGTITTPWKPAGGNWDFESPYETRSKAERETARWTYLMRFHITISNTRPSRIEVVGHTARMVAGTPSEFRREDEPDWTSKMADKLRLKIHTKLERFAR